MRSAEPPSLIGTWSGTIYTPGTADGVVLVTITDQSTEVLPTARGTYDMRFPDPTFNATGGVLVSFDAANFNTLFVTFDRALIPCPREPGGTRLEVRVGVLTLVGNRATGTYLTSGACPFGTMTLARQ